MCPTPFSCAPFLSYHSPKDNVMMPLNPIPCVRRSLLVGALLLASISTFAQFVANDAAAVDKRVNELVGAMTLDEKIDLLGGDTPFRTHPVPRLHIPFFQMADGPVGAHIPAPTVAYAAGIGLAASWDKALAFRIGEELGRDCRSRGAVFLLGPGVNIYRAHMNGRNFEYFGEDPFLASQIAVAYIQGVQKKGVSATVKQQSCAVFTYSLTDVITGLGTWRAIFCRMLADESPRIRS